MVIGVEKRLRFGKPPHLRIPKFGEHLDVRNSCSEGLIQLLHHDADLFLGVNLYADLEAPYPEALKEVDDVGVLRAEGMHLLAELWLDTFGVDQEFIALTIKL